MSNKPLLGGFEKIIVIGLVIFFGYTLFQKGGFTILEKTEDTTILDGKASVKRYEELERRERKIVNESSKPSRPSKSKSSSKSKSDSESILSQLARTFSKGKNESTKKMKDMGLSEDEIKYYKDVKEEVNLTEKVQDAKDWFYILKTSASTYGKVKSMMNEITDGKVDEENVDAMLENSSSSDDFYKSLKETFNISENEAEAFARMGKRKVSDWAKFIEEKGKE